MVTQRQALLKERFYYFVSESGRVMSYMATRGSPGLLRRLAESKRKKAWPKVFVVLSVRWARQGKVGKWLRMG